MIYKVIGLMSGSSLDGLDIVYATITSTAKNWEYQIEHATTVTYPDNWIAALKQFPQVSFPTYATLHTQYGHYIGQLINDFIEEYQLHHKVHFIASHGHTIFHAPQDHTSIQLGDGAAIAATTGITTISDLRNMDIAFKGQGAPIVPIADQLLFADYKYCLNIGGIANISIKEEQGIKAFDICAANQVLNFFSAQKGLLFDDKGSMASQGVLDESIIEQLHQLPFFNQTGAKSLNNDFAQDQIIPAFAQLTTEDALHNACHHIAYEIKQALVPYASETPSKILVTGGGAFNDFLMLCIKDALQPLNIEVIIPEAEIIQYKEALAMALIGILRWREETNVLSSVTGAHKDSIGGALWLAQ